MNRTATVPVKSAWASKINWTQVVGFGAMGLAMYGIEMDLQTQAAVALGIQGAVSVITWGFRTFATKTVTPSSAVHTRGGLH